MKKLLGAINQSISAIDNLIRLHRGATCTTPARHNVNHLEAARGHLKAAHRHLIQLKAEGLPPSIQAITGGAAAPTGGGSPASACPPSTNAGASP